MALSPRSIVLVPGSQYHAWMKSGGKVVPRFPCLIWILHCPQQLLQIPPSALLHYGLYVMEQMKVAIL